MGYEELKIEGRNAVLEAFRSGKTIDKLFVLDGCQDGPVRTIVREAKKHDTIVHFVEKERLDQLSETKKHQGVIAVAAAYEYAEVEDMLKLAEEKGEPIQKTAECVVDVQMEAHIPETYIESLSQRLDIYRKIAAITTEEDQSELLDELIDRYGEPPKAILGLLTVALLRNRAAQLGITEITQRNQTLYFYIEHPTQEQITALACAYRGKIVFNGMQKPYIGVKLEPKRLPLEQMQDVLTIMMQTNQKSDET